LASVKRKVASLKTAKELAEAKVAKTGESIKVLTEQKRQASIHQRRCIEIDSANMEELSSQNKCTAMNSDVTGVLACIKHWARGSHAALMQIVMAVIACFQLQDDVASELGLQQNATNQYIVQRANASMQVLKQCGNEEQRQQYRALLAMLAPEMGADMAARTAAALGVRRASKPFTEAIQQRAIIDKAIAHRTAPLAVGDAVVCRHGQGILVELEAGGSCAVKIVVGEYSHISRFATAGKQGARLHAPPLSFFSAPRAKRSDGLSADVLNKVR